MPVWNSRKRVLATLSHREPDRVPVDLGATGDSSIHLDAYRKLKTFLGIEEAEVQFLDVIQHSVLPEEKVLEALEVDTRTVYPRMSHSP